MTLIVDNSASSPARRSYTRRAPRRRASFRRRRSTYSRGRYGRRRTYGMRRRRRFSRADIHNLPKFVQAQIDPFDTDAIGVKIPDSNTYPSTTIKVEDTFNGLVTDANGVKAMVFLPMLKNNFIQHTPASASSWTWQAAYGGGTDSSRLASIVTNNSLIRTCAHGLKITCTAAPTAVQGSLHVAILASSDFGRTTWNFADNISQLSNAMFYKRYPLAMLTQQTLTVVNKFLDCTSTLYSDPNSDGIDNAGDTALQTNGWAVIVVVIEGASPGATVVSIEQIMHLEGIASRSGVASVSPASPFNVSVQETVSRMAGQTSAAFVDQERSDYVGQVLGSLGQGLSRGMNTAFNNYVLPAAGRAAYAGVGYATRRAFGLSGVTNYRNPSAFQTLTGY